jgi:ribokinase
MRLRSTIKTEAMPAPIIAVVGGLNMDLVFEIERMPDFGESMDALSVAECPGGKGNNTAIAIYRASHSKPDIDAAKSHRDRPERASASNRDTDEDGVRVYMNGTVGNDEFGKKLKAKLVQHGIDVSGVHTVKGERSGTCVVFVEMLTGEGRNLGYQGANLQWEPSEPNSVECLAGGLKPDLIITHLGIPRERIERVLENAGRSGVDTLLNPSPATYLVSSTYKNLTHLLMNETEAAMLSGRSIEELNDLTAWQEAANGFIQAGVKNVVITLGARGAYYATHKGETGVIDAEKDVKVMDTTGAG